MAGNQHSNLNCVLTLISCVILGMALYLPKPQAASSIKETDKNINVYSFCED